MMDQMRPVAKPRRTRSGWFRAVEATAVLLLVASVVVAIHAAIAGPSRSPGPESAPAPVPAPGTPTIGIPVSATPTAAARYVFPVLGEASYSTLHHDYPAADIMAACGVPVVAVTEGMIVDTTTFDAYDPIVNAGETRGGLSVAVLGDDGVRYYGSHLSTLDEGTRPGVRVNAGQRLGLVGETGDASACHLHFGISPPCAVVGDWWIRRGVIWPAPYLDSWRAGAARPPVDEVSSWHAQHGCPLPSEVAP
jgi:murein DD-endopeptidase MepM/ murein hydrolase activator NlpD